VKELLKSDSICQSYAQMKKGPVFLTHSAAELLPAVDLGHAVTVAFVVVASDLIFYSVKHSALNCNVIGVHLVVGDWHFCSCEVTRSLVDCTQPSTCLYCQYRRFHWRNWDLASDGPYWQCVISRFGLVFPEVYRWVLNSAETVDQRDSEVIFSFGLTDRSVQSLLSAISWKQSLDWAIAKCQLNLNLAVDFACLQD